MKILLGRLEGSDIYIALDVNKGFYNMLINESDRWKTTFITMDGKWMCKRVLYGLKNGPSKFQRKIDSITTDVKKVETFIDDILIHGSKSDLINAD